MVGPFIGAVLCKHRVAEYRDGGPGFYNCARVLTPSAPHRHYPGQLILADTLSAFYLTGCGLHCRKALLPRGRKTAPACDFKNTAPDQCVTLTAQSGKVTHAALSTCTRKLNCASPRLDPDTAFSGHLPIRRT